MAGLLGEMYNELAHWKYRSRLQTLKYAWFIRQQTILFTLGYFALHFVSVICPIFPIFWWAIFRVNSMKWKNIPPIFLFLTSLCFASWRTRKPQLFLCSGLILRMNLVSPLLVLYSPEFNISHSSERKCSLCTKSIQERWWLQITRKYFHFLTQ